MQGGDSQDGEWQEVSFAATFSGMFLLSIVLTFTGKSRIEVAVKQILSGMNIKTNASVANPEALDWFREWAREDEQRLPN